VPYDPRAQKALGVSHSFRGGVVSDLVCGVR
jgi:hypothetical protein